MHRDMSKIKEVVTFSIICALFSIPPSLLIGGMTINRAVLAVFSFIMLVIPFLLRRLGRGKGIFLFPWSLGRYIYSWSFWVIFLALGPITTSEGGSSTSFLEGFWTTAMLVGVGVAMIVSTVQLCKVYGGAEGKSFLKQLLEVAVWALPIPHILLGAIFYIDLQTLGSRGVDVDRLLPELLAATEVVVLLQMVFAIAVLSWYYYPWDKERKYIYYPGIFVRVFVWFFFNAFMDYNSYMPEGTRILTGMAMPVFKGSVLVFITPLFFEGVVLSLAIMAGNAVQRIMMRSGK